MYVLNELEGDLARMAAEVAGKVATLDVADPAASRRPELWDRLAVELGWAAIGVPEEAGGAGGSFADLNLVVEQLGRELVGVPLADVVVASLALLDAGSAHPEVVGPLACGDRTAGLCFDADVSAAPTPDGGLVLDGSVDAVLGGPATSWWIVPASTADGPVLALVEGSADGLTATARELADHTREVSELRLDAVAVEPLAVIARGSAAQRVWERARARRATALAAEGAGIAAACLDLARDYAAERRQFRRPIGSFQAVKHRLADCVVATEGARVAARHAATADPDGDLLLDAAAAKHYVDRAAIAVVESCFQVHGGIAFTREHPTHLYYRRAEVNAKVAWSTEACTTHLVRAVVAP